MRLIQQDRLKKYFLYAVGEILLIVTGILVAFQINVWKEQAANKKLQLILLKSIHADVSENINRIHETLKVDTLTIGNNRELLRILKDPESVYHDSMDVLFGTMVRFMNFYPLSLGYESLKSKGLDLIENEALRYQISYLYEFIYSQNQTYSQGRSDWFQRSNDITIQSFETGSSIFLRHPNDFEALKKNQEFINYLALSIARTDFLLNKRYNPYILPKTVEMKEALEAEIARLE